MKRIFQLITILIVSGQTLSAQSGIDLGDLKINQPLNTRQEIQYFYSKTMDAELVSFETPVVRDFIQFDNGLRLNIIYQEDLEMVPNATEFHKGLWIKILVNDFDSRYRKIKDSTAKIIKDQPEKGELYFQAPGGQIFRMVKARIQEG
ncbi:MAG: hypothetical protein ABJF04_18755 [Reichenbachiella sp.]|uniref:hypothetical protein n=1 Tax=Reichenbachiella sp. TaxID=2184521 RepID=UPI0032663E2C